MVLESTVVCVDNSDYMRNGDFIPTRLQAQQDAVNLICHSKTRSNPENNVALLTLAKTEVLVTLTSDVGKILAKLHQVRPKGNVAFVTAVRIAHLVLKHRQGKNHRMRIVVFVGSPVTDEQAELNKLAKRLRKEKVNVDVINFGEEESNTDRLTDFIAAINGNDGTGSHLVTVSTGPMLSDALISSPIIVGEDGAGAVPGGMSGYEFGVDPNEDPELLLALRVSMEEQRARQEEDSRKAVMESAAEGEPAKTGGEMSEEEAMLNRALQMSMHPDDDDQTTPMDTVRDVSSMSEEDQITYALQMSLQQERSASASTANRSESAMETDETKTESTVEDDDYSELMNDPAFLQNVLQSLPGVDPQSDTIRSALDAAAQRRDQQNAEKKKDNKKDENKK